MSSNPVQRMEYYHVHLSVSDESRSDRSGPAIPCLLSYVGSGLARGQGDNLEYSNRIRGVQDIKGVEMWPEAEVRYPSEQEGQIYKTQAEFFIRGKNPLYMSGEIVAVSLLSQKQGLLAAHIPYDTDYVTFVVDMKNSSLTLPSTARAAIKNLNKQTEILDIPFHYSLDRQLCFLNLRLVEGGSNVILKWNKHETSGTSMTEQRKEIFFCYSHEDGEWLTAFKDMLHPLTREQKITVWSDRDIRPGDKWRDEISRALSRADIGVLLVSPSFLRSDFIAEKELPPLLEAASNGGTRLIWVLVSQCLWKHTDIEHYHAAHDVSKPLDSLSQSEVNSTLTSICNLILEA